MPPMQKPVVFIPGFPASELLQRSTGRTLFPPSLSDLVDSDKKKRLIALLTKPETPPRDIEAGQPIRRIMDIAKQAESLYDILRQRYGYTIDGGDNFRAIGWDWRLGVDDTAVQTAIRDAITTLNSSGQRVVVIIHSTGGLVFRRLLESEPQLADKIEHILAFGVPWAGNLKAFRYLTQGSAIGPFFAKLSASQTREVMRFAQAAYDLCPPDPAKTALVDQTGQPLNLLTNRGGEQIGAMVTPSWMGEDTEVAARAEQADQRLGTRANQIILGGGHKTPPITNIVGWGAVTEVRCRLDAAGVPEFNPQVRGRAVGDEKDGDGTVALKAASWLTGSSVRTFILPIGVYPTAGIPSRHPRIWDSPPLEQILSQVLKGETAEVHVCAAADGDEAIDRKSNVTVRLVAADVNGAALPNARATLRLLGSPVSLSFGGEVRANVVVKRGRMTGNAARDMFRFTIDVEWGVNDKRELPILIRV